jgi:hypothetical protein
MSDVRTGWLKRVLALGPGRSARRHPDEVVEDQEWDARTDLVIGGETDVAGRAVDFESDSEQPGPSDLPQT